MYKERERNNSNTKVVNIHSKQGLIKKSIVNCDLVQRKFIKEVAIIYGYSLTVQDPNDVYSKSLFQIVENVLSEAKWCCHTSNCSQCGQKSCETVELCEDMLTQLKK